MKNNLIGKVEEVLQILKGEDKNKNLQRFTASGTKYYILLKDSKYVVYYADEIGVIEVIGVYSFNEEVESLLMIKLNEVLDDFVKNFNIGYRSIF